MLTRFFAGVAGICAFSASLADLDAEARNLAPSIVIPDRIEGAPRNITTYDLARLRDIDSLSLSPDRRRFAILVRQAAPEMNSYRTAWFVGDLRGGALIYAGDGGEARLLTRPNGRQTGDFGGSVGRWSPDGQWIGYTVKRDGEVQVWISRVDGGEQRQLTRNASDVREFDWSTDGKSLYFQVGSTRDVLAAEAEARARNGYRLQEFDTLFRALGPKPPATPLETKLTLWRVAVDGRGERVATAPERADFESSQARRYSYKRGGVELDMTSFTAALGPPLPRGDGAVAWLERADPSQDGPEPMARLRVRLKAEQPPIVCAAAACEGQLFLKIWWSEDGREVLFLQGDGPTESAFSLYAWRPSTGKVRTLSSTPAQFLKDCDLADRALVCLRETPLEPTYVASFDVATGAVTKIGDVNPEMAAFHLGKVESMEWNTGPKAAEFGYAPRSHGVILYPPGYDPERTYPAYVAPYRAGRFLRGDVGNEHPLLVYSANGFVVINSSFPSHNRLMLTKDAVAIMNRVYDPKLGYPHLTIYSESTHRGLDLAMTRANIDPARVGIGGVSHGAFVPLLMIQQRDRFAAASTASGSWSQLEYYLLKLPEPFGARPRLKFPEDADFWAPLDLAQHLDEIEAPLLFNLADGEVVGTSVLIRRMADAGLPVEAFSYPNELHLKWQPAHRLAIYNRNLDWFRFWLQDIEDPAPAKAEQYSRWRQLRELQCRNRHALRDYCAVASVSIPPAG